MNRNKRWHRGLSLWLALCLLLPLIPSVSAADEESHPIDELFSEIPNVVITNGSSSSKSWHYDESITGRKAFRSSQYCISGDTSVLSANITVAQDCVLTFDYAVSGVLLGMSGYDDGFSIQDIEKLEETTLISSTGNLQWESASIPLTAGSNEVTWRYYLGYKQASILQGGWLSNLKINGDVTYHSLSISYDTAYGTATSNGQSIENNAINNFPSGTQVSLVAAAKSDATFYGWYANNVLLSKNTNITQIVDSDIVLEARFAPTGTYVAQIGDTLYTTVEDALKEAVPGDTVRLIDDATLNRDATVSAGVTLLLPYSAQDDGKLKTIQGGKSTSAYHTLIIPQNYTLTVHGQVVVNSQQGTQNTINMGHPTGPYGHIQLNGSLIVADGGVLDVRGFITCAESGIVNAQPGGIVYELFQVTDFRGGSATSALRSSLTPFNQYYVQNIEGTLHLEQGSKLFARAMFYMSKIFLTSEVLMVGDNDNALFQITDGYVEKRWDAQNDHLIMDIYSDMHMNALSIRISIASVSLDKDFPINGNMIINLKPGSRFDQTMDMKLLPGAQINVEQGAELNVLKNLYVYSAADYNMSAAAKTGYSFQGYNRPSLRHPPATGSLIARGNAALTIGGNVHVTGGLFTSSAGQSISGRENGILKLQAVSADSTNVIEARQWSENSVSKTDTVNVPFTFVKSDSSVFDNQTTYFYDGQNWKKRFTVSFAGTDITLAKAENSQLLKSEAPKDFPPKTGYTAAGWDAAFPITVTSDLTLEPKYTPNTYTVSFDPNGGTGTMEQQAFTYDAVQALTPNAFQRENYYFAGWSDTADGETKYANCEEVNNLTAAANGAVTLYAVWRDHFVVTFEGTDVTLRRAPNGTIAETDAPAVPAKTGYTAAGWDASFPLTVNGDLSIKPRYTANSYTVQFDANGGEGAMEAQSFTYDTAQPLTANAFTRNGYHFTGWSTAADGDKLYADKAEVINLTAEAGGAVTLYARWERDTSSGGGGGGGGASTPDKPKEQTTVSPDGTKTTTVTDEKNGTTTEIITASDGSTETVKTQKDGTVESKTELADGTKAEATVKPDGKAEVSATVPAKAIPQGQPLSIETPAGSITLPPETLSTVANAKELSLSVSVTPAANDSAGNVATIRLSVKADGKAVSGLGSITLRVPVGKLLIPDTRTPLADGKTAASVQVTQPSLIVRADGTLLPGAYVTDDTLVVTLTGDATLTLSENAKDFSDVPADHWAHTAVAFATARELFSGTGEHTFSPGSDMTRAMLMTVLARLDGQDVSGGATYYEKAMVWAQSAGISDGKNALSPITREQLAAMLYRYAGSPAVNDAALSFADADQASSYAGSALRWAVHEGLLTGKPGGLLDPKTSATRAEVSAILMRYLVQ